MTLYGANQATFTRMKAVLYVADQVLCTNCSTQLLVRAGSERCPMCFEIGTLSWATNTHEIQSESTVYWIKEDFDTLLD